MPPLPTPASAESGFTLSPPPLSNPFTSDVTFQRVLGWYLPPSTLAAITPRLTEFADEAVSQQVYDWIANAETQQPYVKKHNVWGKRYDFDRLVTSAGWKEVGKWGVRNGVIALGYETEHGEYRRIVQHAHNYIYSASSAVYSCPVSMTSGAARLLAHQLPNLPSSHPFHGVFARLTARENHWVSAQWMTERPGGSDVQNTETVAFYSPLPEREGEFGRFDQGDYLVSGFKFFSSATDCNVAFLLAKTDSGKLSLFCGPTRKSETGPGSKEKEVTNGVRIHRLKNKMGTKELPTAELELKDMRVHLVGPLDLGVPTVALLLNVSRTHNFITALSCWRRALDMAKSFAKARTTIGQPLWMFPMHLRLLAGIEIKHRGALHLCLFVTALLSFTDNGFPKDRSSNYAPLPGTDEEAKVVLRTLTATAKATVCKTAISNLQECQETVGGVGYMDEPDEPEFNISRLLRDTSVNSIWEGTTNVLSSEVVRHLGAGNNLSIFDGWINRAITSVDNETVKNVLRSSWSKLQHRLHAHHDRISIVLGDGRQVMFTLAWIVSGTLLALDAQRDSDGLATEVARRWVIDGNGAAAEFVFADIVYAGWKGGIRTERERANWDCRLVWDIDLPEAAATGYRAPESVASKL